MMGDLPHRHPGSPQTEPEAPLSSPRLAGLLWDSTFEKTRGDLIIIKPPSMLYTGETTQEGAMDTTTLLIIIVVVLLVFGGGWYGRGRWY